MVKLVRFCTVRTDPYYLLGVPKEAPLDQVKQAFYQLAAKYHPDINPSPAAIKHFLLIKEAYDQIKLQKGIVPNTPLSYTSDQFNSVRPNADQYRREGPDDKTDPFIAAARAKAAQYEKEEESFATLRDIKDVRIKVDDVKMKDVDQRFNFGQLTARITTFNKDSHIVITIFIVILFTAVLAITGVLNQWTEARQVRAFAEFLKRESHEKTVHSQKFSEKMLAANIPTIKEAKEKLDKKKEEQKRIQRATGHDYVPVVTESDLDLSRN